MVGTEHRDHADFAMVRLFRGLSWTQQQCTVIQRITVSNISVTALPQVIYLHNHAHWSEKRPWIVACRFQPAGAWERLLQAPARRGAATVWILGTAFCTRGYPCDLRALMSATHKAALLSLARVEEVTRDVAPCVDTGGDSA